MDQGDDLVVVHILGNDVMEADLEGGGTEFSFEDRREQKCGEVAPAGC